MIEVYQIMVENAENGYSVVLYKWDREKDETKSRMVYVFQADQKNSTEVDDDRMMQLAKNKAFGFAKDKLGTAEEANKFET